MTTLLSEVTPVLNRCGAAFWHHASAMFLQSTVLIGLLLAIDPLLRRRARATFRYALWLLVLVKLVLPVHLASPVSLGQVVAAWRPDPSPWHRVAAQRAATGRWESQPGSASVAAVGDAGAEPAFTPGVAESATGTGEALAGPTPGGPVCGPSRQSVPGIRWEGWLFLAWLAGVAMIGVYLLVRTLALRRLTRAATGPDAAWQAILGRCCAALGMVPGKARLGLSVDVAVPAVCGVFHPVIILPTGLIESLPADRLRLVLLHELAHIRRRDPVVNLVQTLLQIIYFYHPLVWVANAIIRRVREQATDETVLAVAGGGSDEYCHTLVDVAGLLLPRRALSVGLLGVAESKGAIAGRVRHILAHPPPRSVRLGLVRLLFLAALGAVVLPLAVSQPAPGTGGQAAAPAGSAAQVSCTGVVTDANGQPLDGAAVACYRVRYALRTPEVSGREEVRTGADGRFTFTGDRVTPGAPEYAVIVAWKDGLALGGANWELSGDQNVPISLGPAAVVSGTVVDTAGRPLGDVAVRVSVLVAGAPAATQWLPGFLMPERLGTRTDAAGRFSIGWLPADATAELFASLPGYGTLRTFEANRSGAVLHYKAGQTDVRLVLPPEATVAGVVRTADGGAPVADLMLHLRQAEGNDWYAAIDPVRTAADGSFRFRSLVAGRYKLETNAAFDATTEWCAIPMAITLAAGQAMADVLVQVEKGGLLELRLVDAETAVPVAGAMVTVDRPDANVAIELPGMSCSLHGQSDKAGVVRLRLWPGEYDLMRQVYGSGYGNSQEMIKVSVMPGATLQQTVRLQKQSSVTGTVRDAKGDPVAGATVSVLPSGGGSPATTDAQGRFQATWDPNWGGMNPRPRPSLLARHFERNLAALLEMPVNAGEVELAVEPGITVSGRVVDEKGKAIAGATVDMVYHDGDGAWMSPLGLGGQMCATNAQGRYGIRAVPAHRKFRVWATRESAGAVGMGTEERPIEVNTATAVEGRVTAPDVVLKTPNLTVSGMVVDETGKPVAGVEVLAFGVGQTVRRAATDSKGRFVIDKVCAGEVQIQASRRLRAARETAETQAGPAGRLERLEGLVGTATVLGGDQDLVIELAPPTSVRPQWSRAVPQIPLPELGRDFQPDRAYYWADFQDPTAVGECWSHRQTDVLPGRDKWVLGRFANDRVTLTLTGLPEHRFVRLYFEVYMLNSWDGHRPRFGGPDLWLARIEDGPRLVYASFVNYYPAPQSYPLPFGLGESVGSAGGRRFRAELPYAAGQPGQTWGEHVVYPMCFTVPHTGNELRLQFAGMGLEPVGNESWALDNVGVALLNEAPPRGLTAAQLEKAWGDLTTPDVAVAYAAVQALVAAGEQSVAFLAARLRWGADPEGREQLAELIDALAHDDRAQWDEVAQETQTAGPRFFPVVFAAVDRRRFGPNPPAWLSELFDGWTPPKDAGPEALRESRAAYVLELIWSPAARQTLLFE